MGRGTGGRCVLESDAAKLLVKTGLCGRVLPSFFLLLLVLLLLLLLLLRLFAVVAIVA